MLLKLALKDLLFDRLISSCQVAAIASILAPLLLLFSLRHGILTELEQKLLQDPKVLSLTLDTSYRLDEEFFQRLRQEPEVGFVIPEVAALSALVDIKFQSGAQRVTVMPTDLGDPVVLGSGIPFGAPAVAPVAPAPDSTAASQSTAPAPQAVSAAAQNQSAANETTPQDNNTHAANQPALADWAIFNLAESSGQVLREAEQTESQSFTAKNGETFIRTDESLEQALAQANQSSAVNTTRPNQLPLSAGAAVTTTVAQTTPASPVESAQSAEQAAVADQPELTGDQGADGAASQMDAQMAADGQALAQNAAQSESAATAPAPQADATSADASVATTTDTTLADTTNTTVASEPVLATDQPSEVPAEPVVSTPDLTTTGADQSVDGAALAVDDAAAQDLCTLDTTTNQNSEPVAQANEGLALEQDSPNAESTGTEPASDAANLAVAAESQTPAETTEPAMSEQTEVNQTVPTKTVDVANTEPAQAVDAEAAKTNEDAKPANTKAAAAPEGDATTTVDGTAAEAAAGEQSSAPAPAEEPAPVISLPFTALEPALDLTLSSIKELEQDKGQSSWSYQAPLATKIQGESHDFPLAFNNSAFWLNSKALDNKSHQDEIASPQEWWLHNPASFLVPQVTAKAPSSHHLGSAEMLMHSSSMAQDLEQQDLAKKANVAIPKTLVLPQFVIPSVGLEHETEQAPLDPEAFGQAAFDNINYGLSFRSAQEQAEAAAEAQAQAEAEASATNSAAESTGEDVAHGVDGTTELHIDPVAPAASSEPAAAAESDGEATGVENGTGVDADGTEPTEPVNGTTPADPSAQADPQSENSVHAIIEEEESEESAPSKLESEAEGAGADINSTDTVATATENESAEVNTEQAQANEPVDVMSGPGTLLDKQRSVDSGTQGVEKQAEQGKPAAAGADAADADEHASVLSWLIPEAHAEAVESEAPSASADSAEAANAVDAGAEAADGGDTVNADANTTSSAAAKDVPSAAGAEGATTPESTAISDTESDASSKTMATESEATQDGAAQAEAQALGAGAVNEAQPNSQNAQSTQGSQSPQSLQNQPSPQSQPVMQGLADDEAFISEDLAAQRQIKVGDRLLVIVSRTLSGQRQSARVYFTVKGIIKQRYLNDDVLFTNLKVLTALDDYRNGYEPEIFSDGSNVKTTPRYYAKFRLFAQNIDAVIPLYYKLKDQHLSVSSKVGQIENIQAIARVMNFIFIVIALVSGIGGALALSGLMLSSLKSRKKNFVLLRLMGQRSGETYRIVLLENLILSTLGFALAFAFYYAGSQVFNQHFGALMPEALISHLTIEHIAGFYGATVLVAALLAMWSAKYIFLKAHIADVLREA